MMVCPKIDKIWVPWIGAPGGYAGVLAHATISEITIFSSMLMSGKGLSQRLLDEITQGFAHTSAIALKRF